MNLFHAILSFRGKSYAFAFPSESSRSRALADLGREWSGRAVSAEEYRAYCQANNGAPRVAIGTASDTLALV